MQRAIFFMAAALLLTVSSPAFAEQARDAWIETATVAGSGEGISQRSFDVSGNAIVAGASSENDNTGAVYVFTRTPKGWVESARLTASDATTGAGFGRSVAISGDTIVAGSWGSAYVFSHNGYGWVESAIVSDPDAFGFGSSVDISGDTIVANSFSGPMYVFEHTSGDWVESARLETPSGGVFDSESISGDTIVAGAFYEDYYTGAAYVFTRTPDGWAQPARLTASDGFEFQAFGYEVDVSAGAMVVGAPTDYVGAGKAYVFTHTPSGWIETAILESDCDDCLLAFSVGISDGTVVSTAEVFSGVGSAYVFSRSPSGRWVETDRIKAFDADTYFGNRVVISDNTILAGDWNDDVEGHLHVFTRAGR